jgi:enoyl-CoA hydratase
VVQARVYDPEGAVAAGYLDRSVAPDEVERETLAAAAALTQLSRPAYAATKRKARAAVAEHIRETLAADLDRIVVG